MFNHIFAVLQMRINHLFVLISFIRSKIQKLRQNLNRIKAKILVTKRPFFNTWIRFLQIIVYISLLIIHNKWIILQKLPSFISCFACFFLLFPLSSFLTVSNHKSRINSVVSCLNSTLDKRIFRFIEAKTNITYNLLSCGLINVRNIIWLTPVHPYFSIVFHFILFIFYWQNLNVVIIKWIELNQFWFQEFESHIHRMFMTNKIKSFACIF